MPDDRRRRGEAGFTLVELLVVLIIIATLLVAAFVASRGAKVSARNKAMQASTASIDQAIGSFNRIYPPVGATDPLIARAPAGDWSAHPANSSQGLADETGEWLLEEWPDNPYTSNGGVVVQRFNGPGPCNIAASGAQPGQVRVCRVSASTRQTYLIRGFGRDAGGVTIEVYRATHGGS